MPIRARGSYGGAYTRFSNQRSPYWQQIFGVLFTENWKYGASGSSGVIEDTPAAAANWEANEIATCGPVYNYDPNGPYVSNGIVSGGTTSHVRRTVSPNIDHTKFHSIKADFIRINADGCYASIGLEAPATLNAGQLRAKIRQLGTDKRLSVFYPTAGEVTIEDFASAVGAATGEILLEAYAVSGGQRIVKVYRDGILKDSRLADVPATPTSRNVSIFFDNFSVNANDRCRVGKITVRGTAV